MFSSKADFFRFLQYLGGDMCELQNMEERLVKIRLKAILKNK